uniref:Uncharacterized protein n=1 Tax=Plectus sambesii TaxID=2011161 RepID=A0A914X4E1_9BILA
MYCFAVLDEEQGKYFTGCINVTDNVEIVKFDKGYDSFCRINGSYSECICTIDACNGPRMSGMMPYTDGNILSTLKFDLVKKAVLVNAAQLADLDQQEEAEEVGSVDVDSDASVPSTRLENFAAAISNTTDSNATSTPVSTIISTTVLAVTKHSNSISSRDYGFFTVFTMIFLCADCLGY